MLTNDNMGYIVGWPNATKLWYFSLSFKDQKSNVEQSKSKKAFIDKAETKKAFSTFLKSYSSFVRLSEFLCHLWCAWVAKC